MQRSDEDVGFIYVLTNEAIPDLLKIGKSKKNPHLRKDELDSTGVPAPFEVSYFALVKDSDEAEKIIHSVLEYCRYRSNREFFKIPVIKAIAAIQNNLSGDILYENMGGIFQENQNNDIKNDKYKILINVFESSVRRFFGENGSLSAEKVSSRHECSAHNKIFESFKNEKIKSINQDSVKILYNKIANVISDEIDSFDKIARDFHIAGKLYDYIFDERKEDLKKSIELFGKYVLMRGFLRHFQEIFLYGVKNINLSDDELGQQIDFLEIEFCVQDDLVEVVRFVSQPDINIIDHSGSAVRQHDWVYVGYKDGISGKIPGFKPEIRYIGKNPVTHYFAGYLIDPNLIYGVFHVYKNPDDGLIYAKNSILNLCFTKFREPWQHCNELDDL